jgi:hypothetical protein
MGINGPRLASCRRRASRVGDGGRARHGIGLFAPPFGLGYYAACAIGPVTPDEGVRPIRGYLAGAPGGACGRRRGCVVMHRFPR